MALIDDPRAWILRLFEMEERESGSSDCLRFPEGITPAGVPLQGGELVFGVYKNKYYFAPTCLIIKDGSNFERIQWVDVCRCSSNHGDGKKFSELTMLNGREVRVRVGDMARGWSGRISQLYHQMIDCYGHQPAMGRPLMPWREFFDMCEDAYSVAPNLEPHPSLADFRHAISELENSDQETHILMDLIDDHEELVARGIIIVTPRPQEDFLVFVESFGADGVIAADERTTRRVEGLSKNLNVWQIVWD
jgi:hypothetical protein